MRRRIAGVKVRMNLLGGFWGDDGGERIEIGGGDAAQAAEVLEEALAGGLMTLYPSKSAFSSPLRSFFRSLFQRRRKGMEYSGLPAPGGWFGRRSENTSA
jgi:hypothetical protein